MDLKVPLCKKFDFSLYYCCYENNFYIKCTFMLKMLLLLEYHFFYWSLVSNTVICMNYSKDMHTHFLTLHFQ